LDHGAVRTAGLPQEVVRAYKESVPEADKRKKSLTLSETKSQRGVSPVVEVCHVGVCFSLLGGRAERDGKTRLLSGFFSKEKTPFWALQDVSFTVHGGDIIGIIGPNGAGKSTLCRVLSGILRADRGEVLVKGDVTALLTFGTGFNDQLTGRDNVYLNGMMLGMPKKSLRSLYSDIVQFADLARFMDEPVKHYSSGMRARLGFSIAAMITPDVLIVDEALSVGDMSFYEKASAKMQELIAQAKAVIVVTHNLAFVEQVCTRALWLSGGAVQFDGNPKEAVARYRQSLRQ
jgi:teichoic acid transport system ATP-binding protein